jgi:methyl-accepting chemotaxis protein
MNMKTSDQTQTVNNADANEGAVLKEILRIAYCIQEGQLDERGRTDNLPETSAQIVQAVNSILDNLIAPLRVATSSIRELSHGAMPDFIITEYKGEFEHIKRYLNSFLSVLYGMRHETQNLIQSIHEGKLNTRGNDWDFEGTWKDLISGINQTLDATLDPVMEAREVLDKVAIYDLTARMNGKYKRDHARIKKSLNFSLQSLQEAFQQVAGAVSKVTSVAEEINRNSTAVSQGASEQAKSLIEVTASMEQVSLGTKQTAENTLQTSALTKKTHNSVEAGKTAMADLLNAMNEIRAAAEGTQTIMQEINAITLQTDDLARNAAREAARVGSSARGFAVVAGEVGKLAQRAKDAAKQISDVRTVLLTSAKGEGSSSDTQEKEITAVATGLDKMALHTNLLALNAAVEAAYVDASSSGLGDITAKVQDLASHTKTSAAKTERLLGLSVELAQTGQTISGDVNTQLMDVVEAVNSVTELIDEIAEASQLQASELEAISERISKLNQVTQVNAESAKRSTQASSELSQQTVTLSDSIRRFKVDA